MNILLLWMIVIFSIPALAQTQPNVYLGGGISTPINQLNSFLNRGNDFHLGLYYPIINKKFISLGAFASGDYSFSNHQNFKDKPESFSINGDSYKVFLNNAGDLSQNLIRVGVGPQLSINIKNVLTLNPIIQFGYTSFSQNEFSFLQEFQEKDEMISKEIFHQEAINSKGLYFMPRLRMEYSLNNYIKLWTEGNYSIQNINKVQRSLQPFLPEGEGRYSMGDILEGSYKTENIKQQLSGWGISAGIALSFSKAKERNDQADVKTSGDVSNDGQKNCGSTKIISPANNATYYLNSTLRPNFSWNNSDENVSHYIIKLYQENKVMNETRTTSNTLNLTKEIDKIAKDARKDEVLFHWNVITYYRDCAPETSETNSFLLRSSNTIEINVTDIECLNPAYDENGNVKYKATIELSAGNNSDNWIVNNIQILPGGQIIPVGNLYNCTNNTPAPSTLTITPNTTQTWCMEFSVPIGSASQTFQANGSLGIGAGNASVAEQLPSCICNICDDWRIISTNERLGKYANSAPNMVLNNNIQILNATPIMQVKAEIVYVQHNVNDPQCYTCTKDEAKMGLFSNHSSSGRIIGTGNAWQNNGKGSLSDENGNGYGNEFTWQAATSAGVDFSTPKSFRFLINMPEFSSLKCCDTKIKICIRYTFTDINCQSCDYLVCYDYTSSGSDTGNGDTGTAPGTHTNNSSKK